MAQNDKQASDLNVPIDPKGLVILLVVGPSLLWAAGLLGTLAFYGYLCVTQVPKVLLEILGITS